MTYQKHLNKWQRERELVNKYNKKLITEWSKMEHPFWQFWKPSPPPFEEQRQIIIENWRRYNSEGSGGVKGRK